MAGKESGGENYDNGQDNPRSGRLAQAKVPSKEYDMGQPDDVEPAPPRDGEGDVGRVKVRAFDEASAREIQVDQMTVPQLQKLVDKIQSSRKMRELAEALTTNQLKALQASLVKDYANEIAMQKDELGKVGAFEGVGDDAGALNAKFAASEHAKNAKNLKKKLDPIEDELKVRNRNTPMPSL